MHSPGHLRDAFAEWARTPAASLDDVVGEDMFYGGEPQPIRWVMDQLWDCNDIMPGDLCSWLFLPRGSTYAQAIQSMNMPAAG